eukprot:1710942-Ditylum_brightwellii.AAC.1
MKSAKPAQPPMYWSSIDGSSPKSLVPTKMAIARPTSKEKYHRSVSRMCMIGQTMVENIDSSRLKAYAEIS